MRQDTHDGFGDLFADVYRTGYAMALAAERGDETAVGDLWRNADHDLLSEAALVLALARIPGQVMQLIAMQATGNDDARVDAVGALENIVAMLGAGARFGRPFPS